MYTNTVTPISIHWGTCGTKCELRESESVHCEHQLSLCKDVDHARMAIASKHRCLVNLSLARSHEDDSGTYPEGKIPQTESH